jgi:hypothetical protein
MAILIMHIVNNSINLDEIYNLFLICFSLIACIFSFLILLYGQDKFHVLSTTLFPSLLTTYHGSNPFSILHLEYVNPFFTTWVS